MALDVEFLQKLKAGAQDQRRKSEAAMYQAEGAIAMLDVLIKHLDSQKGPEPEAHPQPNVTGE